MNVAMALPEQNNLTAWRDWLPQEMATENHGAMQWDASFVALLAQSSPSGIVRFPAFIDNRQPVLICDSETDTWIGLFMPKGVDDVMPSEIPGWAK